MKDYYTILGIKEDSSPDEIRKAFRKLSLKFHPDKNDGDEYFTERFRDVKEAYDVLANSQKRHLYDNEKIRNYHNNGINFSPEIEYFNADKSSFEFDEEITFSWKTINSNKVFIKPFGAVDPIGRKTYKIKDFKNKFVNFELTAENTNIDRQIKSSLKLQNKTYQDLYLHFKRIFDIEEKIKVEENDQHHSDTNKSKSIYYVQHQTDKGIIEIEPCIHLKGKKAFLNNKPAPDGKYKFGFLWSVEIKNGIVLKENKVI